MLAHPREGAPAEPADDGAQRLVAASHPLVPQHDQTEVADVREPAVTVLPAGRDQCPLPVPAPERRPARS
jgi:hypothetical protein